MFDNITGALDAFVQGEIVIVTDDDDRENEGDLIVAASLCTPEKMAFIIRHCCGIVCAPLAGNIARKLHLDPMVSMNDAPLGTAFTVTVDAKYGLTTGISAEQRTNTVRALVGHNAGAADFVRPGHVFPLIAREGGVLMRSGHTEAAVDLCTLAGLPPVGVICELANDDGTVMKGSQIAAFAQTHGLKRISVAELIAYRQTREKLVSRVATFPVQTAWGSFTGYVYTTPFEPVQHLALVYGAIDENAVLPVRLHRSRLVEDVFCGGGNIGRAMQRIVQEGRGVFVYLRDGVAGVPFNTLTQPEERDAEMNASEQKRAAHWHEIGLGAQILCDLGVRSILNLSTAARTYVGLTGFGIEIIGQEQL